MNVIVQLRRCASELRLGAAKDFICRSFLWSGNYVYNKTCPISWDKVWKSMCGVKDRMLEVILSKDEKYNIHRAYQKIEGSEIKVRWCKVAWDNIMYMSQRLPTKDMLLRFGRFDDVSCSTCSQGEDSHSHLLFQCPFSLTCIQEIKRWLGIIATGTEGMWLATWIYRNCRHSNFKRVMYACALAACVYCIWQARNEAIWNKSNISGDSTLIHIKFTVKNRISKILRKHVTYRDSI
ncbi:Unconventional myosin-Ig, partial [Bienertia sinuspersici]